MPPTEIDPVEKKSSTLLWFTVGSLFFLVSVWACYDEFVSRRTWLQYQRQFNRLELQRVEAEYVQAKQALEAEDTRREALSDENPSRRNIRLKIEQAEIQMEGEECRDAMQALKALEITRSDVNQQFGFAKADQDEIYYEWKHNLEAGNAKAAETFKRFAAGVPKRRGWDSAFTRSFFHELGYILVHCGQAPEAEAFARERLPEALRRSAPDSAGVIGLKFVLGAGLVAQGRGAEAEPPHRGAGRAHPTGAPVTAGSADVARLARALHVAALRAFS